MQQAIAQNPNAPAPSDSAGAAGSVQNLFVINLCASTTPVALTPPDHAGLKRFTFFVSRRREEGRERFRLHMGYFESQEEAEKLLDIVREIYPGAWAGLSPGQRLRARAQARAQAAAADATVAAETAQISPPFSARLDPVAAQAPAPAVAPTSAVAQSKPALEAEPVADAKAVVEAVPVAESAPAPESVLALVPDEGRRVTAAHATGHENEAAARALNNVRAAIASLEDTGAGAPTLAPLPELKPAAKSATGAHSALTVGAAREATRDLSESAALGVLENKPDTAGNTTVNQPRLPVIDKSSTPAPAAGARPRDEKPAFAVQLLWSVQPIDIGQIPQLAIFSAYTLYGAEGNRDGRRWYGVRLGFFTDAVSAKQVAHYVRSDFSTVSVVPVTVRERERAKLASTRPDATPVGASPAVAAPVEQIKPAKPGFDFIEDKQPAPAARPAASDTTATLSTRGAPGKRAKLRAGRQVNGRAKSKPMTLEETLEILGAGQLQMDDGRRPLINESSARAPSHEPAKGKPSRFGRLLERLSERLGN